ncbi:MAG: hypothetical protein MI923_13020 [Phycisphaerales bacterium]|nr:hypothetical protein [Phycisphaerales bacterium]
MRTGCSEETRPLSQGRDVCFSCATAPLLWSIAVRYRGLIGRSAGSTYTALFAIWNEMSNTLWTNEAR